jgi:hypothetical protein
MAILIAIEASCTKKVLASNSKPRNKGSTELRRLECSINYDSKGGSSSRGKRKERGLSVLNEA